MLQNLHIVTMLFKCYIVIPLLTFFPFSKQFECYILCLNVFHFKYILLPHSLREVSPIIKNKTQPKNPNSLAQLNHILTMTKYQNFPHQNMLYPCKECKEMFFHTSYLNPSSCFCLPYFASVHVILSMLLSILYHSPFLKAL